MGPHLLKSLADCEAALHGILQATLKQEAAIAARDREIAAIQQRYSAGLHQCAQQIAALQPQIEAYYLAHRDELERAGQKSLRLDSGVIGMRAPSNPALVPLNDKWDWERIAGKVKELFGARKYFHPPKEPALDKTKIKKALDAKELAGCGLKLDTDERFYMDLNRLPVADQKSTAAA